MTVHLVTFSDESMSRSALVCACSSRQHGVGTHALFTPTTIRRWGEVRENSGLFSQPRGCGFWVWKSLIISKELEWLPDGSTLIYSDAGVEFINNINHIIDRMDQDIFLFGNMYEHAHWCKRDTVDTIWPYDIERDGPHVVIDVAMTDEQDVAYRATLPWSRFGKQVQASVIFFRVSDYTRKFVKEWLDWCLFEGGRLIDDSPSRTPNHPEFQEHRHDQAILTTMAYREGIKLHYWPAQYNDGAFEYPRGDYPDEGYPILFHHHRRRNHEWEQVA